MKGDMYLQTYFITQGLYELVSLKSLKLFSVNDFQLLLSGKPEYSVEDVKKCVKY